MTKGFVTDLAQYQKYQPTPKYVKHQFKEDKLAILVCQIKIWRPKGTNWFDIPSVNECLTLRECESIEITKSYKDLISKAVLKFPRGTVISKRNKPEEKVDISTNDKKEKDYKSSVINDATNNGEVITTEGSTYNEDRTPITSIAPNYDNKGLIEYNRSVNDKALLTPNDIAICNRIEIRLGYAYDEEEYKKMTTGEGVQNNLDLAFTGFITSISVDTPLEIECEDMAYVLNVTGIPHDINDKKSLKVNDFVGEGGKYDLLKDTGIELDKSAIDCTIDVKGATISHNLTVADVLTRWAESGIMCYMDDDNATGKSVLRIGRVYYSGLGGKGLPNNDKEYLTYNGGNDTVPIIQFDWDVAEDKLNLIHNDKKYIAVQAIGRDVNNNIIKFTLRKQPDRDDEGWIVNEDGDEDFEGQYVINNEREVKPRKREKKKKKKTTNNSPYIQPKYNDKMRNRAKMKHYVIVPYVSPTVNVTKDKLIAEAKQYWASYVPNGISGSITIFGDLYVKPADIIGLIDNRHPQKNGYYMVDSVNTTFGTGGYRKELHIPFKLASFKENVKII